MTATIEVFDHAMCCSTGVCGLTVNPELARFEADLRWFGSQGASVSRYNLAAEPGEFAARPVVAAMLRSGGQDVLPIVLVAGKLRCSGTWPSRTDLAASPGHRGSDGGHRPACPSRKRLLQPHRAGHLGVLHPHGSGHHRVLRASRPGECTAGRRVGWLLLMCPGQRGPWPAERPRAGQR